PQSELSGLEEEERRPIGPKALYAVKEILRTEEVKMDEKESVVALKVWRSRKHPRGKTLAMLKYDGEMHVFVGE
ncbi:MAG: hypothetical protein ACXQTS_06055, partial [Candidatus Methanospirareceae archaeon]